MKRSSTATSFVSEHSVALSIVPFLKTEIERCFRCVVPIYPWMNRETSKISKQVHNDDQFRVLALFPRRPKLDKNDVKNIFITINPELCEYSEFAEGYGIQVIAGCPIASNFWELSSCTTVFLTNIAAISSSNYLNSVMVEGDSPSSLARITISELVGLIRKSSILDVTKFSEFLKKSKESMPGYHYWFGPRYKPIYFLIKT